LSTKDVLLYAGRQNAAAPAAGISLLHTEEQRGLVNAALKAPAADSTDRSVPQSLRRTS
jgi:hypothetical protein